MAQTLISYDFLITNCTQNCMFPYNEHFVLDHVILVINNYHIFVGSSPYQHNHIIRKTSNIDITTIKTKGLLVVASTHQHNHKGHQSN
jgi:hypothetical protein